MLSPVSHSLSKIRGMTLHVAARTNILLVTWQEDLAVPQPPEQPRLEGEGAPASTGEVSAARPGALCHTGLLLGYCFSPGRISPLPPVDIELPCPAPITVPTFLSSWTKTWAHLFSVLPLPYLGNFPWATDGQIANCCLIWVNFGCKCTHRS